MANLPLQANLAPLKVRYIPDVDRMPPAASDKSRTDARSSHDSALVDIPLAKHRIPLELLKFKEHGILDSPTQIATLVADTCNSTRAPNEMPSDGAVRPQRQPKRKLAAESVPHPPLQQRARTRVSRFGPPTLPLHGEPRLVEVTPSSSRPALHDLPPAALSLPQPPQAVQFRQAPPPSSPTGSLPMTAPSTALESESTLHAQISQLQASVNNLVVQSYLMAPQPVPTIKPTGDSITEGVVRLLGDVLESVRSMQPGSMATMRPEVGYEPYPPVLPWAPHTPPPQHQPNHRLDGYGVF
uniref:Uncharacterized protein n=1 Tax=Mycena chlorophos TaxID=658473 RepID=A0ABQ0LH05_MYCCL|nr:predicted protein [Mycena chlorophos]